MVMRSSPSGHVLYVYTRFQCPSRTSKLLPLGRAREPFSHPESLFEIKRDGFRSLVRTDSGVCKLVSRNGSSQSGFNPAKISVKVATQ